MSNVRCLTCGMSMLSDARSYENHIAKYHSLDGYRVKIQPTRTTDRTKRQIIDDVERDILAPYIVQADLRIEARAPMGGTAKYCGLNGKICVWEDNGWEICGVCAPLREREQKAAV